MSNSLEKLKTSLKNGIIDMSIMSELEDDYRELKHQADELEKLLIMIVRTGWPWDEDGEPNAIFQTSKEGFSNAMREAYDLLGLNYRTMINRTEPRT
ncbi:MAG: hypothetical protein WC156_03510 [Pedobacter sp.]